ncbi:MAG: glycine--tRNA ligase [bacterium]
MGLTLDTIVSFAKQRGFIFPSAEIYGGLSSCYDYGPLGIELKNNIKKAWWKSMIQQRNDIVGLDSAILTPKIVWQASGHLQNFHDPLVECLACHRRFRADHLLEATRAVPGYMKEQPLDISNIDCPECGGKLAEPKNFNLLMKTELGAVEGNTSQAYLRGETCQGIYLNFLNVLDTSRKKIPFGIAQIGKAFRNEITTKSFTFRTREFEQMEMQYFVNPADGAKHFEYWKDQRWKWFMDMGMKKQNLRWRQHEPDELVFYAKAAWDIEYNFSWSGWSEMAGVHYREGDLERHMQHSGKDMSYKDAQLDKSFIPHIVETSDGVDRAALMFLIDAYEEVDTRSGQKNSKHEKEVILKLHKELAPIKIAILPLMKKEPLQNLALQVQTLLWGNWMTQYDETTNIGKRYRRQDEIGTPYCVTIDYDSLDDNCVTVRDRDTMEQERVSISELNRFFESKFN